MKRKMKYIAALIAVMLVTLLMSVPAYAADYETPDDFCDDCLLTHQEPEDHCSYYCTGESTDPCDCGGLLVEWCSAGHQYTEYVSETPGANCATSGTIVYACACGVTVTYHSGPVGDHVWGTGNADTDAGKIYYECALCGETKTEDYTTGGSTTTCEHNYSLVVVDPTCTEQGYTLFTCDMCGGMYKDFFEDSLGHLSETVQIPATCTSQGSIITSCQRDECQQVLDTHYTAALGHNMVNNVCTRCQYSTNCAHIYIEKIYTATCNDLGYTLYTCTICGDGYMSDYEAQLSHVWKIEHATQPSCEQAGHEEFTCTLCGETRVENTNALGHKWEPSNSIVNEDNTVDVTYQCLSCGTFKTENLPTAAAQAQNWLLTSIRGASGGLIDMYNTVMNGIEVGGVTVHEVVAGCLVLVIVLIFFGFAWGKMRK